MGRVQARVVRGSKQYRGAEREEVANTGRRHSQKIRGGRQSKGAGRGESVSKNKGRVTGKQNKTHRHREASKGVRCLTHEAYTITVHRPSKTSGYM